MPTKLFLSTLVTAMTVTAQQNQDSQTVLLQILQRLDSLEKQNQALVQEVRALRQEMADSHSPASAGAVPPDSGAKPPLEERVAVNENRVAEQAQTKVEASQRFPVSLNGTLLFNSFLNSAGSPANNAADYGLLSGPARNGATIRQTLLGLQFQGPNLAGGGQIHASLSLDFGGGYAEPGMSWLRLRRGTASLDWKSRSFSVGQDKPLISPYQPDSLAEVLIPPLAGSGNLWLWLPQARYEERVHLGASNGFTGQLAVLQTDEQYQKVSGEYASTLQPARPALEGRFAFWHKTDDTRRFEVASGFHVSTTHVAGQRADSRIASLDWKFVPWSKLELSGSAFNGRNIAALGSLGNGFAIPIDGRVRSVGSSGGWAQLSFSLTNRLRWNLFSGLENDRSRDLAYGDVARSFSYASNLMYHLGPNVLIGAEALQLRTRLLSGQRENRNHYDLALAYLF